MNKLERCALFTLLLKKLRLNGSWCGETHVQKAAYLVQELCKVPLQLEFILYKHGPYSFTLRDEITAMRADNLLALKPQPYPYRPTLVSTDAADKLQTRFSHLNENYGWCFDFIAEVVGSKGVTELERLATAYYVTQELGEGRSVDERARRLHELKPHIPLEEAEHAVNTADEIICNYEMLAGG